MVANRANQRIAERKYDAANREARRLAAAEYRRNHRDYRAYQRKWKYGMTPEQYKEILERQGGHCAFCTETKGLEVDHDPNCCPDRPTCGKCNRGLLCDKHNRGLGFFTREELTAALEYLR